MDRVFDSKPLRVSSKIFDASVEHFRFNMQAFTISAHRGWLTRREDVDAGFVPVWPGCIESTIPLIDTKALSRRNLVTLWNVDRHEQVFP